MIRAFAHLVRAAAVVGVVASLAVAEDEAPAHKYVGNSGCVMCHKSAKAGEQARIWEESRHATAYETLASDKAKEIAAAKGIDDPQKADECLSCHVTGHPLTADMVEAGRREKSLEPAALLAARMAEGVSCEACHGPGSEYKSRSVMKVREDAIAAGMLVPDEASCKECHNENSPTYKPFDYEVFWAKIAHPVPE